MRGVRIGGFHTLAVSFVPHILDAKDTILQQDKAPAATAGPEDARAWTQRLLSYRDPSVWRSIVEIGISVGPLAALWVAMWLSYRYGFWWLTLCSQFPPRVFWCGCS